VEEDSLMVYDWKKTIKPEISKYFDSEDILSLERMFSEKSYSSFVKIANSCLNELPNEIIEKRLSSLLQKFIAKWF
jgi:hypothetical protein